MANMFQATLLLLSAALLAPIHGNELDGEMTPEVLDTELVESAKSCSQYISSSFKKMILIMTREIPLMGEESGSSQIKCYFMCRFGLMGSGSGTVNVDAVAQKMWKPDPASQERAQASRATCMAQAKGLPSDCESGYAYVQCMDAERKKRKSAGPESEPEPETSGGAESDLE